MMRMVLVRWRDSRTSHGWGTKEEYDEVVEETLDHLSCGFLYGEYEDRVALILSTHSESDEYSDMMMIPREAVLEIIELKPDRKV